MSNIRRDARAYREHAGAKEEATPRGRDASCMRKGGVKVVNWSKDTLVLIDKTGRTEAQTKGKTYREGVRSGPCGDLN